ncbi:hypothetical protein M3Y97_00765300 [Aphelenchoides bicaudatus]|nr:hypothetical protein M3Y97_00765300 [Aphelenchoides bicaudatus]
MGGLMAPLRGIFRSRFPTKLNGAMGDNLAEIIDRFRSGVKVAIKGDPVYPMWGLSEPIVAKLNMPDNEVEENIAKILDVVCKHRSPALGPFINRVTLTLLPSHSYIPIDVERYTPKATEEEIEKAKSKRKSSRAKKAKPADEEKDTEKDDFLISVC